MNSATETKVQYILKKCAEEGVNDLFVKEMLDKQDGLEDFEYVVIYNERGDVATVSEHSSLLEPAQYIPKWTKEMKAWAKAEGFSKEQIKNQDLIREASLNEIANFFATPPLVSV